MLVQVMQDSTPIRILEKDTNRRGDLFGRLMADLFVALGYEQPRLNIHKSGRELDLSADHRLEPRRAVGECKATSEPIGGGDLNKFVGALDAEQEDQRPITGYFISLSGFTETAIEQERQRHRTKIVTLTGSQVIGELIEGRILIKKDRATELAGRCCAALQSLTLDPQAELLAHERGWIWCIYYTQGKARTHFALIHSDGTPLARTLAEEVTVADQDCEGSLHKLTCLNPAPLPGSDTDPRVTDALAAYRRYLENECGYVQLDGLPADSDVGSRRLRLEALFVPLHLDVTVRAGEEVVEIERRPAGVVLGEHPRLALLAAPGGGKSMLIKRLAVAYSDPARRPQTADELPDRDWLPLFFRCRELRGLARGSFAELLEALSHREPVRQHSAAFRAYVDRALLAGRVLLLVDGLDEISDPGDRAAFVCTLRAALQAYPGTAIVAASREAGFRHVAAHLAPVCTSATLSPFNSEDIRRLSVAWHREVVGDTEKVRADAEGLAATIAENDRISSLAVNPLLLTTLLLVKRWVGSLPTRRAVLYGKAVEVLLMTWNTEGHEPIPEEEALPQLCYVASAMMFDGVQKISRPRLAALLQEARECLPTELGYVKGTVDEFIHRVEDRSSLLMMTGHDVEDSRLVEFFEFRHLTFQEFLTARAMVQGWHRNRNENDTLASVLEPHFDHEAWRQVIPLAAVLGGKGTEGLIQRLTQEVASLKGLAFDKGIGPFVMLGNCLADEAAARPDTIRSALRELVRLGGWVRRAPFVRALARGRYGTELCAEAEKALLSEQVHQSSAARSLMTVVWWQTVGNEDTTGYTQAAARFLGLVRGQGKLARCEGALGLQDLCFRLSLKSRAYYLAACANHLRASGPALVPMIFSEDAVEQYCGCWALVWLAGLRVWTPPAEPDLLGRLFKLWNSSQREDVHYEAAYALASQQLLPREGTNWCASIPRTEIEGVVGRYGKTGVWMDMPATLVVAWYSRVLGDSEIASRAWKLLTKTDPYTTRRTLCELLDKIGKSPKETE
jgi:hypothetical protein